ncbi:hypothetical protein CEXT_728231 [Caerostris extrusa]|uniref:Uncharacterized protein n=1 Tax=Caerostris extrusa TaxID=172846 RepID=A0AAV4PAK8_CAEEX|nr:hypothetical protein CEXT_728231 [Caerostris extrusa]
MYPKRACSSLSLTSLIKSSQTALFFINLTLKHCRRYDAVAFPVVTHPKDSSRSDFSEVHPQPLPSLPFPSIPSFSNGYFRSHKQELLGSPVKNRKLNDSRETF